MSVTDLRSPNPLMHMTRCVGKSLITVWAVPNTERKACENLLVTGGLPKLCQWLSWFLHAGDVWRNIATI